jgi:hypothetical protein
MIRAHSMPPRSRITVEVLGEPPPTVVAPIRRHRVSERRWSAAIGIIGTCVLHAIVFNLMILGSAANRARSLQAHGPGASQRAGMASELTLVMVLNPEQISRDTELFEEMASRGEAPLDEPIVIVSDDPLPAAEMAPDSDPIDDQSETKLAVGDPAGRALLFGRYTNQVSARIERAWRRPRSPINVLPEHLQGIAIDGKALAATPENTFRCQVRILQDNHGNVEEVQLLKCNGSPVWQQSLVSAILQASPLSAPPSPTVFTNSLTLTLEAHAYGAGGVDEEYEVETNRVAQTQSVFLMGNGTVTP